MERVHSVSVAGVVVDDQGHVLAVRRRDNGHWEPPGGVLERDETFEEGVVREILEETGLTVSVERLTGAYKNMAQAIVALVYRCKPLTGTLQPTDEAVAVRWLDLAEVDALMAPAYAVRVHDAFGTTAASRGHDGHHLLS